MPLFLLSDIPGDVAVAIGPAIASAFVAQWLYVTKLHRENRSDNRRMVDAINNLADALMEGAEQASAARRFRREGR